MKIKIGKVGRLAYGLAAFALAVSVLLPALNAKASAYGQVTSRSVEMSSSAVSATSTSYTVSFTETVSSIKSVVIDFCGGSSSPLYGDACTAPTGFSGSSATLGSQTGTSGWTITAGASHLVVSGASFNSGTALTFVINGITNPSTLGTFYARIYTYAAQSNDYSTVTAPGTVFDFGGAALSTATTVSITAKVMETLTFCVSGTDLTASTCTSASAPTITLGHGSPVTLNQSAVDTASVYTQTSTNAQTGVIVRMKTDNTCTGLSANGGTSCSIPGNSTTPAAITAGTAAFGLFVANGGLSSGGTGASSASTAYNDGTATHYAMGAGVTGTYGDPIFNTASTFVGTPAPCSLVNNQLTFAATASLTTPAGIYTANESLIATGTF